MRFLRAGRKRATDNSMIPMINVVFLLLIFVMVAGTIEPPKPFDVTPPESAQTQESIAGHTLHVSVDGSLAIDGDVVDDAELVRRLKRLPPLDDGSLAPMPIEQANSSGPGQSVTHPGEHDATSPQRPTLAVRADAGVTFHRLKAVVASLQEAGVSEIELVTSWVPSDAD